MPTSSQEDVVKLLLGDIESTGSVITAVVLVEVRAVIIYIFPLIVRGKGDGSTVGTVPPTICYGGGRAIFILIE
jgi:hypothetical protein